MQITIPTTTERFGAVKLNNTQRVFEIDSGRASISENGCRVIRRISNDELWDIQESSAIIIPIKNEKIKLFSGVITGIPHNCQIIVVSNSKRSPTNRFMMELDEIRQFAKFTDRDVIVVHQKDETIAHAFSKAGYTDILDETNLVRDGKAEGMVVGIALAKLLGKKYVGFVDADNYIPGAIWEYVKDFSAGFLLSDSPYVMVRLSWRSKPKLSEHGTYFKRSGRVSERSNYYMNLLISKCIGFDTNILRTACAGEHAMSLDLAELISFASGFAVETHELLSIFESFGGIMPTTSEDAIKKGIDIFQIETANPHLHEERGDLHIKEMLSDSLSSIYHSVLCDEKIKEKIHKELVKWKIIRHNQVPSSPVLIAPLSSMNFEQFKNNVDMDVLWVKR